MIIITTGDNINRVYVHTIKALIPYVAVLILSLLGKSLAYSADKPVDENARAYHFHSWKRVIAKLEDQHSKLSVSMQNSRDILLKRANSERVEFVERLYLKSPIRRGYQVLPVIKPSPPLASNTPRTQFYSLENLKERLEIQLRTAVELNEKALETLSTVLEPLVIEFELLRWQFHNLENHLAYHAQWQNAAVKQVDFYIERNLIAASIREMLELEDNGNSADLVDEIRESISESVSSFNPIAGLVVKVNDDGRYILPVTVYTDIDNEKFLTAFYEGVEEAFNNSAAAHIQRFAVSLDIHHISAAELYPKDPPVYGSEINLKQHISQFPKGVLILTTGGASTHAWG